jgi:hypothetical protein
VYSHCWNTELPAGTLYSQCDFASICDEDFAKQSCVSFHDHQEFTIFHRTAISNDDFGHSARPRRFDLVEGLHGFD